MYLDMFTLNSFKKFFFDISSVFSLKYKKNIDFKDSYILTETLENIENLDGIIFICFNPRLELPLFNLKIRKIFVKTELIVYTIGFGLTSLTYFVECICNFFSFLNYLSRGLLNFCQDLFLFHNFKFFFGSSLLVRSDFDKYLFIMDVITKYIKKEKI